MTTLPIGRSVRNAAIISMLLVGISGCVPNQTTTPEALIGVSTQPPQPDGSPQPCMAALLQGVLVADARWVVGVRDPGSDAVRHVIWPFGFAVRREGDGVALLDQAGRVVARTGDKVKIGGGFDGDQTWLACPDAISVGDFVN